MHVPRRRKKGRGKLICGRCGVQLRAKIVKTYI